MALAALPDRGFNETPEQGMTGAGRGGEFRVELAAEKPRVIGQLDHFHQPFIPVSYTHLDVYKRQVDAQLAGPRPVR